MEGQEGERDNGASSEDYYFTMLLKHLNNVSPFRGMPMDDKGSASSITTVTGETVQLYYNSSGTLTADAGQIAGTVVVGQLAYDNVKSILGNMEAIKGDSSLSFTAGALTTEKLFDFTQFEYLDETSIFNKMATIGATLSNGEYVVDYSNGTIYGKKTTTASTLAATTYKYKSSATSSAGGSTTVTGNVASAATDSGNPVKIGGVYNATKPTVTDGQRVDWQMTNRGEGQVVEQMAPVYENNTTGKAVVEHNYTVSRVTADGQIKASAGFVHTVTLSATGTVTAGVITLYANTAESGTIVWSGTAQVAMNTVTILLDVEVGTGIYVGYDGTVANVAVTVSYR